MVITETEDVENFVEKSRCKYDLESVVAELEAVDYACHEAENRIDVKAVLGSRFVCNCRFLSVVLRTVAVKSEHTDQFFDVDFDFFDVDAEQICLQICPTVLQVDCQKRIVAFDVRSSCDCNLRRRFEEYVENRARVKTARKVEVCVDVEFKSALDIAKFEQYVDENALEQVAEFLIGKIDGNFSKFAFERVDIDRKSRREIDVEQIRVECAVLENGQICAGIVRKVLFKVGEILFKLTLIGDFTEGNVDAESKSDQRIEREVGVRFVVFADTERCVQLD